MSTNEVSKALKDFMGLNKISSLELLLLISNEDYFEMTGFNYHLLDEILTLKKLIS